MATSKDYLNYLTECFRDIPEVHFRPMMGEYLVYYLDKVVGDVCDNRLLLKDIKCVREAYPEAEHQPPYAGAKPMALVEDTENAEFFRTLFSAMYAELPAPKKKVKKS